MKRVKEIPAESQINNYLPANYVDSFSRIIICRQAITPTEFRNLAFGHLPRWIDRLLKLRNAMVKPLGLKTDEKFTDNIGYKSENEDIFGVTDRHLTFHVSMWCGEYKEGKEELRITTVVKYNNWFGRLYFLVIRPFHTLIIRSIINNIQNKQGTQQ